MHEVRIYRPRKSDGQLYKVRTIPEKDLVVRHWSRFKTDGYYGKLGISGKINARKKPMEIE